MEFEGNTARGCPPGVRVINTKRLLAECLVVISWYLSISQSQPSILLIAFCSNPFSVSNANPRSFSHLFSCSWHYIVVTWSWCFKSPATQLFVEHFVSLLSASMSSYNVDSYATQTFLFRFFIQQKAPKVIFCCIFAILVKEEIGSLAGANFTNMV